LIIPCDQWRWEAKVPAYRFYLLDARGHVIEARDLVCEDDACAEALARGIVAENRQVHAIEAWLRPRLICRAERSAVLESIVRVRPCSTGR
jgi:hypothetical protein